MQYGTMKVFEWGPVSGRKVLLVHGVSTPCVSLAGVAHRLVSKGCRVILFDLFGRGYSDGVGDLPYDSRLYTTQILLAITSSPLAWTPDGFSIIGYSLGGGACVDFAASCPSMVKDVVLLAPAGLIRIENQAWLTRFAFNSGLIPDAMLRWNVRRRFGIGKVQATQVSSSEGKSTAGDELRGNRDPKFEAAVLSIGDSLKTVADAVQWQVDHHDGFVGAFLGSVKYSSLFRKSESMENWRILGKRKQKVLVVAGTTDSIIILNELHEDVNKAAGVENVVWKEVDGGHEFPISESAKVVDLVSEYWGL
jgi:pimeloyl-ACP methyl ester carboxylesterase